MDRRAFLAGAGALLLTGCATVQPTANSAGSSSTPSGSVNPLVIGVEQTASGALVGGLLTGALAGAGGSKAAGTDWLAALGDQTLSAGPVYAGTVWAALSDSDEPSDDVLGDLASLVGPTVGVLTPGSTDGGLVWMVSATAGPKSLEGLAKWSQGKKAAVPSLALERADGISAINTIYGTRFGSTTQDDPVARAQLVASGQAGIGAFRRTDYLGGAAVVELADPDKVCASDPLALLVNAAFADRSPEQALALNAVIQALTNGDLNALSQKVAQGSPVADVASEWLVSKGLVR